MSVFIMAMKKILSNRYVQIVLIGLLLAGGGYAFGRYAQPAKVVEKTRVETKTVTQTVYQDKIIDHIVYVKEKKEDKHTTTTTTKTPDGTVVTKTETEDKIDTSAKIDHTKDENKVVTQIVYQDKIVEKLKLVESKKLDWRLAAGAGVSIPTFLGKQQIGIPGLSGAVIQVEVDRRIIGPVFLGLWGNSQGTTGLSLSAVF